MLNLATLVLFCYKNTYAAYFCTGFAPDFVKNRKKYGYFLQFFLAVYQLVRRNLKKKLLKTLDKI